MALKWMPQNIQKRVLLYVLQQLSIFSQIDLPNLEVSLGSNSQITLSDVQIDTDAFQIPGIHLRNGAIENLRLQLNMSDGVNIEGGGVSITVALAPQTKHSMTHSEFIDEKSKLSLAQSTLELANSIMIEGGNSENSQSDDNIDKVPEIRLPSSPTSGQQQSTLNSMMSKAVEVALSKLNVNVKNINVRVVLENATIDIYIDSASFVTLEGIKIIEVSDLTIVAVNPTPDQGETNLKDPGTNDKSYTEGYQTEQEAEDESDGSDDGEDEIYQSMAASSILQRPGEQNTLDSQESSRNDFDDSIYMSATSNVFSARKEDISSSTKLVFITSLKVEFGGIAKMENLNIMIDEVRVAATPLPLTLLHIIKSLEGLGAYDSFNSRYSNVSQRLKNQKDKKQQLNQSDNHQYSLSFDYLHINKIVFDLKSALSDSGEFYIQDSFKLILEDLKVQKKGDSQLIFGYIKNLIISNNGNRIGGFELDQTRYDIRFEYKLQTNDFTLLLPKNLDIVFDWHDIDILVKLSSLFPQIFKSSGRIKPQGVPLKQQNTGSTTIQTSSITLLLKLPFERSLSFKFSPISYDTSQSLAYVSKIQLSQLHGEHVYPLLKLINFSLQSHSTERQVKSFDSNGNEVVLMTRLSASIKSIEMTHDFSLLNLLISSLTSLTHNLEIPRVETVFKPKRKSRITSNPVVSFQTRQVVKLSLHTESAVIKIRDINDKFGDITVSFNNISILIHNDDSLQLHSLTGEAFRTFERTKKDYILEIINPDDTSAPVISFKTKNFKIVTLFLRNVSLNYHAKWLALFGEGGSNTTLENDIDALDSSSSLSDPSKFELKIHLIECGIGLNPSRLSARSILVIPSGNIDLILDKTTLIKSELRTPVLLLIDDIENILSHEQAKKNRNIKTTWSQATFLNTKGFSSVAKADSLSFGLTAKRPIESDRSSNSSKITILDIEVDSLSLELCADSWQCLMQLLNDLKQPIVITPESKYKVDRHESLNVFADIEENAFSELPSLYTAVSSLSSSGPLNIIENYYQNSSNGGKFPSSSIQKDLREFSIKEGDFKTSADNTNGSPTHSSSGSERRAENSDSDIFFNDDHFQRLEAENQKVVDVLHPMTLNLLINEASINIYDGYDWKYTRRSIRNAISRLEKKAQEEKIAKPITPIKKDVIVTETLFESIHVGLPLDDSSSTAVTSKINEDTQHSDQTIEVGKNNIKKLKLHRSKRHKVLMKLKDIQVDFILFSNQDPLIDSDRFNSQDTELINSLTIDVKDFEVIDNVPTSTWNKFLTLLKDVNRESGSSMLKLNMQTIRPVPSLAATEFLLDIVVLPLRLHVDQDTLEVLVRFGEFKDSRFLLIDEFEDIPYIQKFHINSIPIKLDYKPKKVDYVGLKSGRTTEFMNFFILDESKMVLKEVTLYGISGFPKLGILLNSLWTPDIKQTQLSGVLAGLAPVRSIVNISSGFKDLIVIPVEEYKKDGRVYRSLSKGVQQFTKNTTNELLKFGIKLAAGTQTLLENTEEALGGVGSSARLPIAQITTISEEPEDEEEDDDWNLHSSQLIGRSPPASQQPLHRSIYKPTLESMADINDDPYGLRERWRPSRRIVREVREDIEGDTEEDESQRTISLYANQPQTLKEGILLAYDSLGRNFLVAKDAVLNAGSEIAENGTAHDTTLAIVKATPVALIRPIIGATEAASKALLGINNQFDPKKEKFTHDKYKQLKK